MSLDPNWLTRLAGQIPPRPPNHSSKMAVIRQIPQSQALNIHRIAKRSNWASKNPGVVLVFCIVFLVGLGIVSLFIYRRVLQKKAEKEKFETAEGS